MSFFIFATQKSSAYAKIRIDDEKKAFDGPFFRLAKPALLCFSLFRE